MQTLPQYEYLPHLTQAEFKAVISILRKYGVKGLLGTVLDVAEFNLHQSKTCSPAEKGRAERVSRELGALIERLDGFEELIDGE